LLTTVQHWKVWR